MNRVQGMNSTSLCSLAGRYDNPIPSRFLAPIDCLKIPALYDNPIPAWFLAPLDCLKIPALASGRPPLFSLILHYVSQHMVTDCYSICHKEASSHSLVSLEIHITGTERSAQVRPTIGAVDRTSGQPQVKLSLLRSISLKIQQHVPILLK